MSDPASARRAADTLALYDSDNSIIPTVSWAPLLANALRAILAERPATPAPDAAPAKEE